MKFSVRSAVRGFLGVLEPPNRKAAARYVEVLTAVGTIISAAEILVRRRAYRDGSLLGRIEARPRNGRPATGSLRVTDLVRSYPAFIAMQSARLLGAALLLVRPPRSTAGAVAARMVVAVPGILHATRSRYGQDGADQVSNLTWSALTIFHAAEDDELVESACLWFITLQVGMSYLTASAVKAVSPVWRGGTAVERIVRTRTYGDERLWRVLDRHPSAAKAMSRLVVVGEGLFPLLFVLPPPLRRAQLAAMAGFHLAIGGSMGLHRFLWGFVGTYPAVAYCAANWRAGRD